MSYSSFNQKLPPLHKNWNDHLKTEFEQPYFKNLAQFIVQESTHGKTLYPPANHLFEALNRTPLDKVKVVILGQDPYHGPKQAHGLAFSVQKGCKVPPSLKNMHKELASDVGFNIPEHGDLSAWADQGVLLLNTALTVEERSAASHRGKGWEGFTDAVIKLVNLSQDHVVFLLWGSHAIQKRSLINESKHVVLSAPHPSPLSAHRGFLGCKHFSKANDQLKAWGKDQINWQI